ncbi:MAG: polymer-forming cytoskeletal protein [Burkholderiaceae bacterium]|jgi:cytoskeletal protein CcmA (bactofilin family)|nr:polymer-forming cytoskeletal protein [Burkholderiaceae bacterium]
MFGSKKNSSHVSVEKFSSLLAGNTTITGDLEFEGGLKVNGTIKGNVKYKKDSNSLLALSAEGRIEGNIHSYDALIDGTVVGDLEVEHLLELHANAHITGNITYRQLSMENGVSVDGRLIKITDDDSKAAEVLELPAPQTP